MEQSLTTVHEALAEAASETGSEEAMATFTFRAHSEKISRAKDICMANGTTLSEYLRKCMEVLARDYQP